MKSRWVQLLRGFVAGSFATGAAAIMHAVAGGTFANPVGIILALTFSAIVCTALAGRTLSRVRLSSAVTVSQLAFHLLFSTLGGSPNAELRAIGGHHAGHYLIVDGTSGHPAMAMTAGMTTSGWMWLAHALAAIMTITVLRTGERALWAIVDSARMLVVSLWGLPTITPTTLDTTDFRPSISRSIPAHRLRVFLDAVSYRGPPAGIRFA